MNNSLGVILVGASLALFDLRAGPMPPLGGAVVDCTVINCRLIGNAADRDGGGAAYSILYSCVLTDNSVRNGRGGGAYDCTLYDCILTGNSAPIASGSSGEWAGRGGGACGGALYNCIFTGNSAWKGGGSYRATLHNCTLAFNVAARSDALQELSVGAGGGVYGGDVYNCIVHSNVAENGANCFWDLDEWDPELRTLLRYSCTAPLPTNGLGNIDADPRFVDAAADDFRLRPDSPCIDAGTNLTALITTDILGLPRAMDGNSDGLARFDMGAYEFNPYRFEPVLHVTPNGLEFTVRGEPGRTVRIERSRNLVNWEVVATVPVPVSGQTLIDPAANTEPFLFYRAVSVP